MIESYKTVFMQSKAEHIVSKSVFLATIAHIESENEAKAFIDKIKKEHYDARHNCYAYVLKQSGGKTKCSDDGEPAGTAGRPILDVLEKNGLTDTIIVVTRYFGGILLGAGGLVRAYSTAASKVVSSCEICTMQLCEVLEIEADYKEAEILKKTIEKSNIYINSVIYSEKVVFELNIPFNDVDTFLETIKYKNNIISKRIGKTYTKQSVFD